MEDVQVKILRKEIKKLEGNINKLEKEDEKNMKKFYRIVEERELYWQNRVDKLNDKCKKRTATIRMLIVGFLFIVSIADFLHYFGLFKTGLFIYNLITVLYFMICYNHAILVIKYIYNLYLNHYIIMTSFMGIILIYYIYRNKRIKARLD